jgi:hypothetical protein
MSARGFQYTDFLSDWILMESQISTNVVNVEHHLKEVPIKVTERINSIYFD